MPTLTIHFTNVEKRFTNVSLVPISQSTTLVATLLPLLGGPILLEKKHDHMNSLLDMEAVTPYVLLFFDDNGAFISATFSLNPNEASFAVQTQATFVLLVPHPVDFDLNQVSHISLNEISGKV